MPLTESDLRQFTGTEQWHRHGLIRKILFTDGVKHVADRGGAHWLVDKIATAQMDAKVAGESFQVWRLVVAADSTAALTCDDGDGNVLSSEAISFTDFPIDRIEFYLEGGVIMLPSER